MAPSASPTDALEAVRRRLTGIDPHYGQAVADHYDRGVDTVGPETMSPWADQAAGYSASGPAGVSYLRVEVGPGRPVNCLLRRDDGGDLIAVLNHFPDGIPGRHRPGAVVIRVRPDHRHEGLGSELVVEMLDRGWTVDPFAQHLTPEGAGLARSLIARLQPTLGPEGQPGGSPP